MQLELYNVLLSLADVCGDEQVRRTSMQLLEVMPTDRNIVGQLSGVLGSKAPCQGMRDLLIASGVASKPARLLYTLQALLVPSPNSPPWSACSCVGSLGQLFNRALVLLLHRCVLL